jgi:hypothetical protein
MYQLIIEDSAGDVTVVPLQHEKLTIGRQPGNVVRLTDQNVSRRHARLVREGSRYFVEDLSSFLGTLVNGRPIQRRARLGDGDEISIGDYHLTIRDANAVATAKAPRRPQRRIRLDAVAAWARSANGRAAALLARARAFWAAPTRSLEALGSMASFVKVAMPDGSPGSLALGLPMVSNEGNPPPAGSPGGEAGDIPRASGSPVPPPLPAPARPPGTALSSVGKQILRLRGTLTLGVVALVMVIVGVLFAPPREGSGGIASAVRNALPKGASGIESPSALLQQAQAAFEKGRWSDTLLLLARVSALSPGLTEVENLRRATLAERKNQAAIEAAERALDLENYGLVLEHVAVVSRDSAYRDRAQVLVAAARANLVAQHLATAQSRQAAGNCRLAQKEAEAALALEPDNPTAKEVLVRCPRAIARPSPTAQNAPARPRKLLAASPTAKPEPAAEPRRTLAGTSDGVLPPIFASPPVEKSGRRPIEAANPYAGDLK